MHKDALCPVIRGKFETPNTLQQPIGTSDHEPPCAQINESSSHPKRMVPMATAVEDVSEEEYVLRGDAGDASKWCEERGSLTFQEFRV